MLQSIITGGGKWVEITIPADPLYQHLLLTAEKKFWRCVESGEPLAYSASSRRGRELNDDAGVGAADEILPIGVELLFS